MFSFRFRGRYVPLAVAILWPGIFFLLLVDAPIFRKRLGRGLFSVGSGIQLCRSRVAGPFRHIRLLPRLGGGVINGASLGLRGKDVSGTLKVASFGRRDPKGRGWGGNK